MKKIIAFAGSNSKESINKELAVYASRFLENVDLEVLDLNNFPLPIYGVDEADANGIPLKATEFLEKIQKSDGIVLSLAEHNGCYSAVFKNIFDWCSIIDGKLWAQIPMLLMATSPGERGGQSVLEIAKNRFPYMGGNIVASFSLPSFYDNFKEGAIVNDDLKALLTTTVASFQKSI